MAEKEQTSTTRTVAHPFYGPYAKESIKSAEDWYKQYRDTPYYRDPYTTSAQEGIAAQAGMGTNPLARMELARTLSGAYLDPTQDPRFSRTMDTIENRIGSRFAATNRLGSGAFYNALADAEGAAAAELYGQERGRMIGGLALSPSLDASSYLPYQQLGAVGQQREAEHYASEGGGLPLSYLQQYQGMLNSSPLAGYTGQQTPYYTNPVLQGFGYANTAIGTLDNLMNLGQQNNSPGGFYGSPQQTNPALNTYSAPSAQELGALIYGF